MDELKQFTRPINHCLILSYKELDKWNNWIEKDQWFKKSLKKEELLKINNVREEIIQNIKIIIKEVTKLA